MLWLELEWLDWLLWLEVLELLWLLWLDVLLAELELAPTYTQK